MAELESLYTAAEMRAAEARYPGYPDSAPELMERAGAQAAQVALHCFATARRWTVVCGGGSDGGGGGVAARHPQAGGKKGGLVAAKAGDRPPGEPPGVVAAPFGTGFTGETRPRPPSLSERVQT